MIICKVVRNCQHLKVRKSDTYFNKNSVFVPPSQTVAPNALLPELITLPPKAEYARYNARLAKSAVLPMEKCFQ